MNMSESKPSMFFNDPKPLGIFEDLPYDIILIIEEKRHRNLMAPIFETIKKYVPKPEIQCHIDYYVGPNVLSYEGDDYRNYELVLPDGLFFVGHKVNGMTIMERRMINWTLDRRMFIRNTRKQHTMSIMSEKWNACNKFEYVLSAFGSTICHDDSESDWTESEASDSFQELWSSEDEFEEASFNF